MEKNKCCVMPKYQQRSAYVALVVNIRGGETVARKTSNDGTDDRPLVAVQ